jgi:hypothetical protein
MPNKLTLDEVEIVARHMAPEWWESLTQEERFALVDRFNREQAAEEDRASKLPGKAEEGVVS